MPDGYLQSIWPIIPQKKLDVGLGISGLKSPNPHPALLSEGVLSHPAEVFPEGALPPL
jgi:hypothetical protein